MLFEDEVPPISGEEARARRVRPVEERYDPDKLSHWSITMTIAWIVWGDLGYVRQQWNDFREECADWTFYTDPAALAEVGRLALRNLENGEVAPNDPKLDLRLQKGEWRLTPWGPSSWHGLEMIIRSEDIPPDVSIDGLWLAAGEGKIQASGLDCANEKTFNGRLVEIPHYLWPKLRRAKEPSGKAVLIGPDRVYRDVEFPRLDVKKLWPLGSGPSQPQVLSHLVGDTIEAVKQPAIQDETSKRRIAEREIEPTFERWRAQQAAGYVPTAAQDVAYMKTHGVSRKQTRDLIKKFGGRARGDKPE